MQKIFVKYFLYIVISTVLLTILSNALIWANFAENSARENGGEIVKEISNRIDNNNREILLLTKNMNENYIARAKAFAEIIAQNPDIVYSIKEMNRIAKVLSVDEVHVSDENGILRWGNVPKYFGFDFTKGEQMRSFVSALTDKNFAFAQEPEPNTIENKLFQYIGVARQDKPGIVQIGISPDVLKKALENNEIHTVISNFNVDDGVSIIAFDKETGLVVGDTDGKCMQKSYKELGIPEEYFSLSKNSGWISFDGKMKYYVFDKYDKYIIGVSFLGQNLVAESKKQNLVAGTSSLLLGLIIIIAILILLKNVIIKDMEKINSDLRKITEGNLDVVVTAKNTPEFLVLSECINNMVVSLKEDIKQIENQAEKLEMNHKNIVSSLNYARRIQNNLLPEKEVFQNVFYDYSILWEPRDVVGGDIYWIKNFEKSSVVCICDCTGHGTPGALLTMVVVTALESIVKEKNCQEPDSIMWELEKSLIHTLSTTNNIFDINDGADLAVLCIDKENKIRMSSANTRLFICDGENVENIRGQKLSLGEGKIKDKSQIKIKEIPYAAGNKYYIASDGIFDQIGDVDKIPYGYQHFMQILLKNHNLTQESIASEIWKDFLRHMGRENRRDDIVLLSFELKGTGE